MCGVCGLLDNGPAGSDPLRQDIPPPAAPAAAGITKPYAEAPRLSLTEFHGQWLLASPTGQQGAGPLSDRLWKEAEDAASGDRSAR